MKNRLRVGRVLENLDFANTLESLPVPSGNLSASGIVSVERSEPDDENSGLERVQTAIGADLRMLIMLGASMVT